MYYHLQIMSDELKREYLRKKKKQIITKYLVLSLGYLIMGNILGGILYWGTDGEMLLYVIAVLVISGGCSVMRVIYFSRREIKTLTKALSGSIQYVKIRPEFDCEIKFQSVNGEKIVKSFSSKKYAPYVVKQQVNVMYASETSKWYMEKEEMV